MPTLRTSNNAIENPIYAYRCNENALGMNLPHNLKRG